MSSGNESPMVLLRISVISIKTLRYNTCVSAEFCGQSIFFIWHEESSKHFSSVWVSFRI